MHPSWALPLMNYYCYVLYVLQLRMETLDFFSKKIFTEPERAPKILNNNTMKKRYAHKPHHLECGRQLLMNSLLLSIYEFVMKFMKASPHKVYFKFIFWLRFLKLPFFLHFYYTVLILVKEAEMISCPLSYICSLTTHPLFWDVRG